MKVLNFLKRKKECTEIKDTIKKEENPIQINGVTAEDVINNFNTLSEALNKKEFTEQDFLKIYERVEENLQKFGIFDIKYKFVSKYDKEYYIVNIPVDLKTSSPSNTQLIQQYINSVKNKNIRYQFQLLNYMYWCKIVADELKIPVELTEWNIREFNYLGITLIRLALDRAGIEHQIAYCYERWYNGGLEEVK